MIIEQKTVSLCLGQVAQQFYNTTGTGLAQINQPLTFYTPCAQVQTKERITRHAPDPQLLVYIYIANTNGRGLSPAPPSFRPIIVALREVDVFMFTANWL